VFERDRKEWYEERKKIRRGRGVVGRALEFYRGL
jgi:hypothetical protein